MLEMKERWVSLIYLTGATELMIPFPGTEKMMRLML